MDIKKMVGLGLLGAIGIVGMQNIYGSSRMSRPGIVHETRAGNRYQMMVSESRGAPGNAQSKVGKVFTGVATIGIIGTIGCLGGLINRVAFNVGGPGAQAVAQDVIGAVMTAVGLGGAVKIIMN